MLVYQRVSMVVRMGTLKIVIFHSYVSLPEVTTSYYLLWAML